MAFVLQQNHVHGVAPAGLMIVHYRHAHLLLSTVPKERASRFETCGGFHTRTFEIRHSCELQYHSCSSGCSCCKHITSFGLLFRRHADVSPVLGVELHRIDLTRLAHPDGIGIICCFGSVYDSFGCVPSGRQFRHVRGNKFDEASKNQHESESGTREMCTLARRDALACAVSATHVDLVGVLIDVLVALSRWAIPGASENRTYVMGKLEIAVATARMRAVVVATSSPTSAIVLQERRARGALDACSQVLRFGRGGQVFYIAAKSMHDKSHHAHLRVQHIGEFACHPVSVEGPLASHAAALKINMCGNVDHRPLTVEKAYNVLFRAFWTGPICCEGLHIGGVQYGDDSRLNNRTEFTGLTQHGSVGIIGHIDSGIVFRFVVVASGRQHAHARVKDCNNKVGCGASSSDTMARVGLEMLDIAPR